MATLVASDARTTAPSRRSERAFLGVSALLFAASLAVTIVWFSSMSAMGGMRMAGGWTMSMTWMRMPGQTWPGAAASFLGMWTVMMVPMMLPVLLPVLRRYRESIGAAHTPGPLTALVGAGYFLVWSAVGAAVYPVGVALAALAMQQPAVSRAVPAAIAAVVLIAGALQFTRWKACGLACCRHAAGHHGVLPADAGGAWRLGLRLGVQCARCCGNLMAVLLVIGIMDPGAMVLVAAAIRAERLAGAGERLAGAIGVVVLVAGILLMHAAHASGDTGIDEQPRSKRRGVLLGRDQAIVRTLGERAQIPQRCDTVDPLIADERRPQRLLLAPCGAFVRAVDMRQLVPEDGRQCMDVHRRSPASAFEQEALPNDVDDRAAHDDERVEREQSRPDLGFGPRGVDDRDADGQPGQESKRLDERLAFRLLLGPVRHDQPLPVWRGAGCRGHAAAGRAHEEHGGLQDRTPSR